MGWTGGHSDRVGRGTQSNLVFFYLSIVFSTVALYVPHCNRMKFFCTENKILEEAFFLFLATVVLCTRHPANRTKLFQIWILEEGLPLVHYARVHGKERRNYKRMNKVFLFKFL
ncbi:hypothetical protein ACB092_03G141400 [Castanea dentata]